MKAFEISGTNGTFLQLEDGRYADTVIGDTSENIDAHDALDSLQALVTEDTDAPFYSDFTVAELEQYVGAV